MKPCDGCDQTAPTRPYLVTHHDDTQSIAAWCSDCAYLASIDWHGEANTVTPTTTDTDTRTNR
jgi:hypothetical protein